MRQWKSAARTEKDEQRHPQAVIAEKRRQRRPGDEIDSTERSIMLRMSRDQVAPMKMPSIWKARSR